MLENIPMILLAQSDWAILVLRLTLGFILLAHGYPKLKDLNTTAQNFDMMGFRPGRLFGTMAGIIESFGGAALIVGFMVQWVALVIALQFVVINIWRIKTRSPFSKMEFDLLILGSALALATLGAGAYQLW